MGGWILTIINPVPDHGGETPCHEFVSLHRGLEALHHENYSQIVGSTDI